MYMRNCCNRRRNCQNNNICLNFPMNDCMNNRKSAFPENYLYGYAYTPHQNFNGTFTPNNGLKNGTMFPELISPYSPGQSMNFINSLRNERRGCNDE